MAVHCREKILTYVKYFYIRYEDLEYLGARNTCYFWRLNSWIAGPLSRIKLRQRFLYVDSVWLDTSRCSPPNVIQMAVRRSEKDWVVLGSDTPYMVMPKELDKGVRHCGLTDDKV